MLDPKGAVQERIVLLGGTDLGPDAAQARERAQGRSGHIVAVIPDEGFSADAVRRAGKFLCFHSDGYTSPLIPGLIEAGFSGLRV